MNEWRTHQNADHGRTRRQRSRWTWSTSLSTGTSGIHLQTQTCMQNTSWEWTGGPDLKRIYAAAKSLQSYPTLCDPIDGSPPGSPVPGILQGKNTGVGCHCLLQCMQVKSESEVAQSCPTLSDPMDRSPPGFFVHGIFQARVLEGVPLPSSKE